MRTHVAHAIVKFLEKAGVEVAFGYNGHGNWALLDAVAHESGIRGIKANAEDTAVHMADCFWRMRRKAPLPVVLTTVGPGNMNICAALANAFYESSAMLILAGAGPTQWMDRGSFEECYRYGSEEFIQVVKPICKKAVLAMRPDTALEIVVRAYKEALSGRPGPVVVQLPFDVQHTPIDLEEIPAPDLWTRIHPPGPDPLAVSRSVEILKQARRPLLLAGSGVHNAGAAKVFRGLAEAYGIPAGTTFSGKGALAEDHPLSVGTIDPSGTRHGWQAARECDVLVAAGVRFQDFNTLAWNLYPIPGRARLIHIDIDPIELSRNYPAEVAILSDARLGLEALVRELAGTGLGEGAFEEWRNRIAGWRAAWIAEAEGLIAGTGERMSNARLLHDACEVVREVDPDTSVLFDTGNMLLNAPAFYRATSVYTATNNGHFARMGWSCGGALGARLANPDHPSLAFIGDGSFMMTGLAISTAVEHDIPAVWVILNNRTIGIEREAMEMIYKRSSFCDMQRGKTREPYTPDYVKMASSMGVEGRKVTSPDGFRPALREALRSGAPFVLDVDVDAADKGHRIAMLPMPFDWRRKTLDEELLKAMTGDSSL
ncbi:MAG: thiamine pyrophosphate-binding protein [bacterium]